MPSSIKADSMDYKATKKRRKKPVDTVEDEDMSSGAKQLEDASSYTRFDGTSLSSPGTTSPWANLGQTPSPDVKDFKPDYKVIATTNTDVVAGKRKRKKKNFFDELVPSNEQLQQHQHAQPNGYEEQKNDGEVAAGFEAQRRITKLSLAYNKKNSYYISLKNEAGKQAHMKSGLFSDAKADSSSVSSTAAPQNGTQTKPTVVADKPHLPVKPSQITDDVRKSIVFPKRDSSTEKELAPVAPATKTSSNQPPTSGFVRQPSKNDLKGPTTSDVIKSRLWLSPTATIFVTAEKPHPVTPPVEKSYLAATTEKSQSVDISPTLSNSISPIGVEKSEAAKNVSSDSSTHFVGGWKPPSPTKEGPHLFKGGIDDNDDLTLLDRVDHFIEQPAEKVASPIVSQTAPGRHVESTRDLVTPAVLRSSRSTDDLGPVNTKDGVGGQDQGRKLKMAKRKTKAPASAIPDPDQQQFQFGDVTDSSTSAKQTIEEGSGTKKATSEEEVGDKGDLGRRGISSKRKSNPILEEVINDLKSSGFLKRKPITKSRFQSEKIETNEVIMRLDSILQHMKLGQEVTIPTSSLGNATYSHDYGLLPVEFPSSFSVIKPTEIRYFRLRQIAKIARKHVKKRKVISRRAIFYKLKRKINKRVSDINSKDERKEIDESASESDDTESETDDTESETDKSETEESESDESETDESETKDSASSKVVNKEESARLTNMLQTLMNVPLDKMYITTKACGLVSGDVCFKVEGVHYDIANLESGMTIPANTKFTTDVQTVASFILFTESHSAHTRLRQIKAIRRNAIVVSSNGVPDHNTRNFVCRLKEESGLPCLIIPDYDPGGLEIMMTLQFGSSNSLWSHEASAIPDLQYLGLTSDDAKSRGTRLTTNDIQKLNLMKTRFYLSEHGHIKAILSDMIDGGKKMGLSMVKNLKSLIAKKLLKLNQHQAAMDINPVKSDKHQDTSETSAQHWLFRPDALDPAKWFLKPIWECRGQNKACGTPSRFVCPECGVSLSQAEILARHIKEVHKRKKTYDCLKCGITFKRQRNLLDHDIQVHLQSKPHKCRHCEKTFARAFDVKVHISAVHLKIKPFKCTWAECQTTFPNAKNLSVHISAVHLKLKPPHKCTWAECTKTFARPGQLSEHVSAVHRKLKPYTCDNCNTGFAYASTLSRHVLGCKKSINTL